MTSLKKASPTILMITLAGLLLAACGRQDSRDLADKPYEQSEFLMGTFANIKVYNTDQESAADAAFKRVKELDQLFSSHTTDSEIARINQQAGVEPVPVSDEVFYVMQESLKYAEESNGAFDPTIGALTRLWSIGQETAAVPSQQELDKILPLVDYQLVELNESDQTIFLKRAGMKLDLGAIAKGYITDEASETLVESGVDTAVLDMGGDIFVLGNSVRGVKEPWKVGIQNPFENRGEIIGSVPVTNEAIVTTGIYEQVLEENGKTYHHLLDPKTGYPFDNDLAGISVTAKSAVKADAVATAAFALGRDKGMDYINRLNKTEAVMITKDRKVFVSEGYADSVDLTNREFELVVD